VRFDLLNGQSGSVAMTMGKPPGIAGRRRPSSVESLEHSFMIITKMRSLILFTSVTNSDPTVTVT
jgi:hypothetical protein